MAHNLAVINGQVAMAYQGETPWHQLGARMDGVTSVAEALKIANLDWIVSLHPMQLADGTPVPMRAAILRDIDRAVLGTASPDFGLVQNRDAFGVLTPAIEQFGLTIESAGALGIGARTWMLVKFPGSIAPIPGDDVNGYAVIVNGHDGTHSFEGVLTPIRVVCQNTLSAAVGEKAGDMTNRVFKLRHTSKVNERVDQAAKLMADLSAALKATGETFAQLAKRRMTPKEVIAYIEAVFPSPKEADTGEASKAIATRRATVAELVWSGVGAELAGSNSNGTNAWAAYSAVTEYFDHVMPAEAKSPKVAAKRNLSALFGSGAAIKLLALQKARELVAA